ncbi:fluoride efflux transporter CrcB [Halalkalibacillus halophilus]|uniref:fluoride efflux transporter CrcB n=1 Tax=Halalkalibacillus halophilus TaxID=392827 RepID=UPI0003F6501D|nr:fluoride efflux transporter CrcB [Halalkalibacillus halophilus]
MDILFIALGGAVGAIARFYIGIFLKRDQHQFPLAILLINLIGALGLGVFLSLYTYENTTATVISVGFFGAFTTFSTFSMEALNLIKAKRLTHFIWYVGLSIVGAIALFAFGFYLFQ